jgi:hemerythrin
MNSCTRFFERLPVMQHALSREVRWGDELSAGDPVLDAQARAIFGFVDEIEQLWRRGVSTAQIRLAAERAQPLLQRHFRREERMLADVGYPDRPQHLAEHREILKDLASLDERLKHAERIDPGAAASMLANFLLGVTMGHIRVSDREWCEYVADQLDRAPTGCA